MRSAPPAGTPPQYTAQVERTAFRDVGDATPASDGAVPDPAAAADGAAHGDGARLPLIAVLGVHGVGDHAPGAVARGMIELLTAADAHASPADAPSPDGFSSHAVAIPLRPLAVVRDPWPEDETADGGSATRAAGPTTPAVRPWRPFLERRGYFQAIHRDRGAKPRIPIPTTEQMEDGMTPDVGRVGHEYLRLQLECYDGRGEERVHHTTRWEGRRAASDPAGAADLHVYEMHYADLSRGGSSIVGFLRGLYQVLLHLPTLGRQALDAAVVERRDARWRFVQSAYTWSVRLLTLGVPVLNGVMLLAGLALLPAIKLPPLGAGIASLLGAVVGAYALALALARRSDAIARSRGLWLATPLAAATVAGLLMWRFVGPPETWEGAAGAFSHARWAVLLLSWAAAGALGWAALGRFERVRRGARLVGGIALAAAAAAFVSQLARFWTHPTGAARVAELATFGTIVTFFVVLGACWTLLFGTALATFLGAVYDRLRTDWRGRAPRTRRTRAALRTALLGHALSTAGVLLAVVFVWSGVFQYAIRHVDVFRCLPARAVVAASPAPWLGRSLPHADPAAVSRYDVGPLVLFSAPTGPGAPDDDAAVERCGAAAAGDTVGGLAVGTAPGLVREATQGPTIRQYARMLLAHSTGPGLPIALGLMATGLAMLAWMVLPSVPFESDSPRRPVGDAPRARRLGRWLRSGLDSMARIGWIFASATFVVTLGFALAERYGPGEHPRIVALLRATTTILDTTGAFLAVSAVAALAIAAKLGSTALDVVLDVDNYLRTYPEDSTPTARIMERYASILRHLCAYERDGRRYDAIVVVAHSLGTAVTADVLHLLARQAPELAPDDPRPDAAGRDAATRARDAHPDAALHRLGFGATAPTPAERLPVHLFTMGNPLRQLMHRFFPHRFWWVRAVPDGTAPAASPPPTELPAAPTGDRRPHPADLRVASWSNAYRAGDYVGRELWLDRWYQRTADDGRPATSPPEETSEPLAARTWHGEDGVPCWEACLGTGAHTHYWDDTAPDVAARLDALVGDAVRAARAVPHAGAPTR